MKNTILNQIDAEILELIQYHYGEVVTVEQIYSEFSEKYSQVYLKKVIHKLSKKGWLVRLKRGLYLIANLQTRGFAGGSQYLIANSLVKDSYVSFGLALQYYGMFDQMLATITSVSTKQHQTRKIQSIKYRYITTDKKYFYGWSVQQIGGSKIRIVDKEKALIDMLQFHRKTLSIDLVLEKLQNHSHKIDHRLLIKYVNKSNLSVQRTMGFLLDLVGVDTAEITVNEVSAKMTSTSDQFNAKWRLYYDQYFNKYL